MPKISELTAGTAATGAELIPVVQSGQTVRLTAAQILSGGSSFISGAVVFETSTGTYSQDITFTFDSTLKQLNLNASSLYSNGTLILDTSGNITATRVTSAGNLSLGAANTFAFTGRSIIQSPSDGNLTMLNTAGTAFTSLKFGGATASFPEIKRNATALNFRLADDSADAAITAAGATFSSTVAVTGSVNANGTISAASTSASALTVGAGGANNPAFQVDASTASQVAGLKITGAATGGTVALAAVDTGSNTNLSIDAKGSGTIIIGGTSTGAITHTRASTFSAAITYGGVTLNNAVTGTGNMVLSATPTFTGTPILAAPSATTLIVGSSATLPASPAPVTFTANTTTLPAPATGTILHVAGADSVSPIMLVDGFAGSPSMTFRTALTSAASKSAVTSGTVLMNFGATGFGATAYSATNKLQIVGKATENWSDTAQGTSIQFNTVPNTTIVVALAMIIQNSGGVAIGTSTDPGIGALLANTSIKSQGATAGIGYATGAGGTISQGTNRTTGVTLNTVTGAITLFSQVNTAVSGATAQSFTLTNSAIAAADVVHVTQKTGTDKYLIFVTATAAGSCQITNFTTGGTTNEAPVFSFAVIKGVTS